MLQRWALAYLLRSAAIAFWFHAHYGFGLNASPSLPHRLFLIHKGEMPGRGRLRGLRWPVADRTRRASPSSRCSPACPATRSRATRRDFHLNGVPVGVPKPVSRQGQLLEPGPTGHAPEGRLLRASRTPDSLDSRYQLTGWIHGPRSSGGPMRSSDPTIQRHGLRQAAHAIAAVVFAAMVATVTPPRRDLGVIGPVYPIAEPNLLEVILGKLRGRRSGTARPSAARVAGKGPGEVEDPAPVAGNHQSAPVNRGASTTTRASSCRRPSPTPTGRVIVPPGTVVNPLDTVTLRARRCSSSTRAIASRSRGARKLIDERQGKVKVILTGGSYLDLMRRWQRPVFYDQQGNLTTKLGIRHVPALVTQDGRRLRIDELL